MGFGTDTLKVFGVKEIVGVSAEQGFRLVAEQPPARRANVEVASVRFVQAEEVAGLSASRRDRSSSLREGPRLPNLPARSTLTHQNAMPASTPPATMLRNWRRAMVSLTIRPSETYLTR